jgi:CRISPR/Cas system-associated exonuclease Cas4 (RecB family)
MAFQQPRPGHPVRRDGKAWIAATWAAKALGGAQCLYSPWFQAHFRHEKFEEEKFDLVKWNREHTSMVRGIVAQLREEGWTVRVESENDFKIEGSAAIVAGKPDIIATMPGHTLVIDAKTGRQRESDAWQVFIYLYALKLRQPELFERGKVRGEVHYKHGGVVAVRVGEIDGPRRDELIQIIKTIAAPTAPAKAPSRPECKRCSIGIADCRERVMEEAATTKAAGF